jgi:LysR family nitrogen assimilation transcriptional regulator
MTRSFEPKRLRYFLRIAELGSLTRAAEELHVAQPALSQHMRALEDEVGVKLLQRTSRGVALTEAGTRMVHEGRELLATMGASLERVRESHAAPGGEVVIGVGQTIGSLLVVPLIEQAAQRHPGVRIQVREMLSGLLPELVRAGGVDFAISYNTPSGHGIAATPLLTEELCLVGQRRVAEKFLPGVSGTVTLADVARLPLFLSRRGHMLRELVERAATTKGLSLQLRAEVDSLYIMKELALGGTGFTILSRANFGRELEHHDVFMARIVSPRLQREVCLVRRAGRAMAPAAAEMARLATAILARMVRDNAWKGTLRIRPDGIRKIA